VPRWVLGSDCDGVFRSDGRCFSQDRVSYALFNLLYLLNGLFFSEAVEKYINIRGWSKLLVIVVTQRPFGSVMVVRYGNESRGSLAAMSIKSNMQGI
jgi:hypothetical protein